MLCGFHDKLFLVNCSSISLPGKGVERRKEDGKKKVILNHPKIIKAYLLSHSDGEEVFTVFM